MDQQQQELDLDWEAYKRRMNDKFWAYFHQATTICVVVNATIIGAVYRYTHHPNPLVACIQLLLPLIVWEILLIMSFCPNDVIEFYLAEVLIDDNLEGLDVALVNLMPGQRRRFMRVAHSGGDVMNSESRTNADFNQPTDTTLTDLFLTERQIPTPYQLTE